MGYRKVLVAVHVQDKGTALLDESLDLAAALGAEVMFFCCIGQETLTEADDRMATVSELDMQDSQRAHDRQRQDQLTHVRSWLQSMVKVAADRGIKAEADAEEGEPARSICSLASHWGADLIVVGHSSRHPVKALLIGNTNVRVLKEAPCAVLVMKNR